LLVEINKFCRSAGWIAFLPLCKLMGWRHFTPDRQGNGEGPAPYRHPKKSNRTMDLEKNTDLTQHPPRSPRVRLGGYALLPRMLDKGRATLAEKNGEYKYACPLDQRFLDFVGIDPEALKQQLYTGKGDGEILEWIQENAKHKRTEPEIAAWSNYAEQRAPGDPESRKYFNDLHEKSAPQREDVRTWFDLLDLDDYVSFGGKP
jgi:hypothetical protein